MDAISEIRVMFNEIKLQYEKLSKGNFLNESFFNKCQAKEEIDCLRKEIDKICDDCDLAYEEISKFTKAVDNLAMTSFKKNESFNMYMEIKKVRKRIYDDEIPQIKRKIENCYNEIGNLQEKKKHLLVKASPYKNIELYNLFHAQKAQSIDDIVNSKELCEQPYIKADLEILRKNCAKDELDQIEFNINSIMEEKTNLCAIKNQFYSLFGELKGLSERMFNKGNSLISEIENINKDILKEIDYFSDVSIDILFSTINSIPSIKPRFSYNGDNKKQKIYYIKYWVINFTKGERKR